MRTKLIFNPSAETPDESPIQLMDVVHEMQAWDMPPETCLIKPGCGLPETVQDALDDGIRTATCSGGDGRATRARNGASRGTRVR